MKKRIIFVLSLSAILLVCIIHSCMDKSIDQLPEKNEEKGSEQLINNAMRLYYDSVEEGDFVVLRSSSMRSYF